MNGVPDPASIQDILRHPLHAMRNRAHLRKLLGVHANIDHHFKEMVSKTRSLAAFVAESMTDPAARAKAEPAAKTLGAIVDNPDLAVLHYVQKLGVHDRIMYPGSKEHKKEQVFFKVPENTPDDNGTPRFLQLHFANSGVPMAKFIFQITAQTTQLKIKKVSPDILQNAVDQTKAAKKEALLLAAEARKQAEEAAQNAPHDDARRPALPSAPAQHLSLF